MVFQPPGRDDDVPAFIRELGLPGPPFFDRIAAFPRPALSRLRALGLAGKVLLGSDFPNIPHPYADQLAGLVRLDLGADWLRAVCWDNAARLFGAGLSEDGLFGAAG